MSDQTKDISRRYGDAVSRGKRGLVTATGHARFADYSASGASGLPPELLETSFGCGDPVTFSALEAGQTVLDLGCGAGLDLILAAEKVGPHGHVIGVDMTDAMLERARDNITASGHGNVEVRKGIIESLPVESGSVDWVISNCVINLSANKPRVFAEIARVLRPGGRMLVSDIVAEDLPFWVRRSGLLTVACAGGAISEAQYLAGLGEAGLRNAQILARQYYEPAQMAAVALEAMPKRIAAWSCCGYSGGEDPADTPGWRPDPQTVERADLRRKAAVELIVTASRSSTHSGRDGRRANSELSAGPCAFTGALLRL